MKGEDAGYNPAEKEERKKRANGGGAFRREPHPTPPHEGEGEREALPDLPMEGRRRERWGELFCCGSFGSGLSCRGWVRGGVRGGSGGWLRGRGRGVGGGVGEERAGGELFIDRCLNT